MNEATRKKLARSGFKPTPKNLHATLQRGSSDMAAKVELCLQAGVSPDTREPKRPGRTPLMSAPSHPKPQPMLVARLLEAGANPALTDEDGWSAVAHLAARFQGEAGKGLDTFAKRRALLTAHPDVTPDEPAPISWTPQMSRNEGGYVHGEKEEAELHPGVQGRGGPAGT